MDSWDGAVDHAANARLIAAAPALLEALEALHEAAGAVFDADDVYTDAQADGDWDNRVERDKAVSIALDKARAAIAQARGEDHA